MAGGVAIDPQDGPRYEKRVRHRKGDQENSLTWEKVSYEFESLAEVIFFSRQIEEIKRGVKTMEQKIRDW